jgi:branched-chain amino acid transport system permease protein
MIFLSSSLRAAARCRRAALLLTVAILVLLVLPAVLPSFYLYLATRILILGLLATAFNVVFGFGGMPSLGHAAFFGTGAYVVGISTRSADLPFAVILTLTLVVGAGLGVVFGLLNLRVRGIYLLLLTLALGQAVFGLAFSQPEYTGGDSGIANITRDALPIPSAAPSFYWFTLLVVALSLTLMWLFVRSPVGMAIIGMRESESRLAMAGYRVGAYRVCAFAVSGTFAALAGLLDAYLLGSVSPANLAFLLSAEVMLFAILGGARYFFGPLLGATIILSLEVYVSTFTERWNTVLGVVFILTALFMRDGVLGRIASWRRGAQRKKEPEEPSASDELVLPVEAALVKEGRT